MPVPLIEFRTNLMSELANFGDRNGIGIEMDAEAGWLPIAGRFVFVLDHMHFIDATLCRNRVDETVHALVVWVMNPGQDCVDMKTALVVYHDDSVVMRSSIEAAPNLMRASRRMDWEPSRLR